MWWHENKSTKTSTSLPSYRAQYSTSGYRLLLQHRVWRKWLLRALWLLKGNMATIFLWFGFHLTLSWTTCSGGSQIVKKPKHPYGNIHVVIIGVSLSNQGPGMNFLISRAPSSVAPVQISHPIIATSSNIFTAMSWESLSEPHLPSQVVH